MSFLLHTSGWPWGPDPAEIQSIPVRLLSGSLARRLFRDMTEVG